MSTRLRWITAGAAALASLLLLLVMATTADAKQVQDDAQAAVDPAALERARGAAGALMRGLLGRLTAALAEGGPAAAVEVCSQVAPEIAAASSGEGLSVGRTSLRTRNPANAPDEFERRWLRRFVELHDAGELPDEVAQEVATADGGRELRYLRPIVLGADVCLRCHGSVDELDPEVRSVLADRYPEDRATGYRLGELRGAVTVHVALDGDGGGP